MKLFFNRITLLGLIGLLNVSNINAQICTADFTDSIDSVTVYITNTATGSYNWVLYDMGDGTTFLNQNNPTHTYQTQGYYSVCQIIQDTNGFCIDGYCDTLEIGSPACGAFFESLDDSLTVDFTNMSLGSYDSLSWDFGDGSLASSVENPVHTYDSTGSYTVCLSLFDSLGNLCDSACENVFVFGGGGPGNCVADFTSTANGLTVSFQNLSTGNYNLVLWNFGDGSAPSNQMNPVHTYNAAGGYQVSLLIQDTLTGQCFDQTFDLITVTGGGGGGNCEADFSYSTAELTVEMTNTSSGSFLTAFWDYGDGGGFTPAETYTYDEPGEYEVCLTIGNIFPFCADQYCETIEVTEITCEPSFTYTFDASSNVYSFTNTTTVGNVTSVLWEFGDGNTSTFNNPSYSFNLPGEYQVCLTTFDGDDLCGIACQDVGVFALGEQNPNAIKTTVFPNPNNGSFDITLSSDMSQASVQLKDLAGRTIYQRRVENQRRIAVQVDVPAGMYVLEVAGENGNSESFRVVVQ